jgi:hypothetical protein
MFRVADAVFDVGALSVSFPRLPGDFQTRFDLSN